MPYSKFKPDEMILRDLLANERTLLANERTLLAYVRTALVMIGLGVTFVNLFPHHSYLLIIGYTLFPIALSIVLFGLHRYFVIHKRLPKVDPS